MPANTLSWGAKIRDCCASSLNIDRQLLHCQKLHVKVTRGMTDLLGWIEGLISYGAADEGEDEKAHNAQPFGIL